VPEADVNKRSKQNRRSEQLNRRDKRVRWCQSFNTTSSMPFNSFPLSNRHFEEVFRSKKKYRTTTATPTYAGMTTRLMLRCNYRVRKEMRSSTILLNVCCRSTLHTDISRSFCCRTVVLTVVLEYITARDALNVLCFARFWILYWTLLFYCNVNVIANLLGFVEMCLSFIYQASHLSWLVRL